MFKAKGKIVTAISASVIMIGAFASSAFAAPFNATNNPQIVANYSSGDHGVVGEFVTHNGADVVMRAGNSGNFQQWFYGTSDENGGNTEGDHSIWRNVGDSTDCHAKEVLVENASASWGDYLQPGANYCVKTNDFHVH